VRKLTFVLVICTLLAAAAPAAADGKFYGQRAWEERVPPGIPYQRALLVFAGGQGKYQLPDEASGDFGWVVPVPSLPEVGSMEPWYASQFFEALNRASAPKAHYVREKVPGALAILSLAVLLALPVVAVFSVAIPRQRSQKPRKRLLQVWGILAFTALVYLACGVVGFITLQGATGGTGQPGIEVVRAEQVGIYDVQVLRSREAVDLVDWLNQHQFQFDEADTGVFEDYLQQGWYFVVARVDPVAAQYRARAVREGLVAPLILRFQAEAPIYPLALTATAGQRTQVLLYLLGEGRWEAGGRLRPYFAGTANLTVFEWAEELEKTYDRQPTDPAGFFAEGYTDLAYLCRFKGTLSPAEMRQDLTFKPADSDEPYRKTVILW
jgi:hypothetical protein